MFARIAFSLAMVATVLVAPQLPTLIIAMGKPLAFLVAAPIALMLWVAGSAVVLERNPR